MTSPDSLAKFGKFVIADKELLGKLKIAGKNSLLYVRDDERFDPFAGAMVA